MFLLTQHLWDVGDGTDISSDSQSRLCSHMLGCLPKYVREAEHFIYFTTNQSMYILIAVALLFKRAPVNVAQDTVVLVTLLKKMWPID